MVSREESRVYMTWRLIFTCKQSLAFCTCVVWGLGEQPGGDENYLIGKKNKSFISKITCHYSLDCRNPCHVYHLPLISDQRKSHLHCHDYQFSLSVPDPGICNIGTMNCCSVALSTSEGHPISSLGGRFPTILAGAIHHRINAAPALQSF